MNKEALDSYQLKFYKSADSARFYWKTDNIYIKEKEVSLLRDTYDLVSQKENPLFLEVGCGEGANIVNLINIGARARFSGVDFQKEKIEFCNNLPFHDISFEQADAKKLPFSDQKFDIVFARDLLHHVYFDSRVVLDEMWRVLKTDGFLILIEPNPKKILNLLNAIVFPHERGILFIKEKFFLMAVNRLKCKEFRITKKEKKSIVKFVLHYKLYHFLHLKSKFLVKCLYFISKLIPEFEYLYFQAILRK